MTGCAAGVEPSAPGPTARLHELERRIGARIGVAAIDTRSGLRLGHRPAERFAMCSTFKAPLVGLVLSKVERGELALHRSLPYAQADILDHAPVAKARLAEGAMTVEIACAAAVEVSDNTAANLLLREVGGPPGLTAFLRSIGDSATRLDRVEPSLNTNVPGDPRDTTTPHAMCETIRALVVGEALGAPSREKLRAWMESSTTGRRRLRAGLPPTWRAGDKTGTCENGAANDVAVAWAVGREPIVVASYVNAPEATMEALEAAHVEVMRFVIAAMR
jgi:beta-lactamase class A